MSFQPAGQPFSAFIFQSGMETRLHLMVSSCFWQLSAEAAFFVLTAEAWLCPRLVSVCREAAAVFRHAAATLAVLSSLPSVGRA